MWRASDDEFGNGPRVEVDLARLAHQHGHVNRAPCDFNQRRAVAVRDVLDLDALARQVEQALHFEGVAAVGKAEEFHG